MKTLGIIVMLSSLPPFWRFVKAIRSDKKGAGPRAFIWFFVGINCLLVGLKTMQQADKQIYPYPSSSTSHENYKRGSS